MNKLIKSLLDNGHKVELFGGDFYSIVIDQGEFILTFETWDEAEEIILDYIINEANL